MDPVAVRQAEVLTEAGWFNCAGECHRWHPRSEAVLIWQRRTGDFVGTLCAPCGARLLRGESPDMLGVERYWDKAKTIKRKSIYELESGARV